MREVCTGTPISWLDMEMYALDELAEEDRRRVEAHLGSCDVCRDCMGLIERDSALVLEPLPAARTGSSSSWLSRLSWPPLGWATAGAGLAAATLAALLVVFVGPEHGARFPGSKIEIKGGELALSLVRHREGAILHEPTTYLPGDRFKALITCPPGEQLHGELAIFQDGEVSFPLKPARPLRCGNRIPLPGAFRLGGTSAVSVCLVIGPRPPDRDALAAEAAEGLPPETVCARLEPVAGQEE